MAAALQITALVDVSRRELDLALRVEPRAGDRAELGVASVLVGLTVLRPVEDVEALHAQFQRAISRQGERLEDREVHHLQIGTAQHVASPV